MAQTFWVSTGGIAESYETVNIVTAFVAHSVLNEPVFGKSDPTKHLRAAVDELARQAQQLGANGVLWINFDVQYGNALASGVLASGTAVRVRPA
jgi:uncharacterized protein YbjQ (UPF0145 family)